MRIKEIIVVEGKDDERAVKQAVEADVIITSGFQISQTTFKKIELAQKKTGVIIFTDPDYPGEQIRKRINEKIKGCKNAYLTKRDATKGTDIGIENATPQNIMHALKQAKCQMKRAFAEFTKKDLFDNRLAAANDASKRRELLGKILGIGYANSRQFEKRLNAFNISRQQFNDAIDELNKLL